MRARPYALEGCRHVDLSVDWRRPEHERIRRPRRMLQRFVDARFGRGYLRVVRDRRARP